MDAAQTKEFIDRGLASGAKMLPDSIRVIAETFCGCGSPEVAWLWIMDYLDACDRQADSRKPTNGPEMIACYLLSHLKMTEHGTSINWCWLTDRGREALKFLKEYGPEWEETQEWVDSTGSSWGMH